MIPLARTNKLLITQVGEEVIVYDQERDTAHCLNAMAARVWHYCDGQNTVEDIAKLLEADLEISADEDVDWRGLVWLTLEELERFYLIQEYLSQPISSEVQSVGESQVSRRKMIKTATLVGGFAVGSMFPLVKSSVAPAPGMAAPQSPTPSPTPTPTPSPSQNCSDCGFSDPNEASGLTQDAVLMALAEGVERARSKCMSQCAHPCTREFSIGPTVLVGGENNFQGSKPSTCECSGGVKS
jgi:hypothetical protein